jgi:hypothetical protein
LAGEEKGTVVMATRKRVSVSVQVDLDGIEDDAVALHTVAQALRAGLEDQAGLVRYCSYGSVHNVLSDEELASLGLDRDSVDGNL